jgi:hypothetical protein
MEPISTNSPISFNTHNQFSGEKGCLSSSDYNILTERLANLDPVLILAVDSSWPLDWHPSQKNEMEVRLRKENQTTMAHCKDEDKHSD